MRKASLQDITKFLECKRLALVGVSRQRQHFSRIVLREFVNQGYDAVPVNPQIAEIECRKCFARVADITPPAEAALLMTGSQNVTGQLLQECLQTGIRKIWIYKGTAQGSDAAAEARRSQNIAVVEGHCPLMFLPHSGFVHRAHGFLMKVTGHYPS